MLLGMEHREIQPFDPFDKLRASKLRTGWQQADCSGQVDKLEN
jgi:hypothetical protein